MIKAIILDWGGVLIDDPTPGLMSYCARSYGVDQNTFIKAYAKYEYLHNTAKVPENDFWKYIAKELNVPNQGSEELWYQAFKSVYSPRPEMFNLINKLHLSGYKTGFLSNTEPAAVHFFREQHYDMFDVTVFSCQEHCSKPDPEIYLRTLKRLGTQPDETLFIDDRSQCIEGANQVGIKTIQYLDSAQTIDTLKFMLHVKL
jgi:putative hydrolase of the HAD superfamily